jgi:hypothetical protein
MPSEARRAYLKVAGLDLDAVDPWSRPAAWCWSRTAAPAPAVRHARRSQSRPAFELVAATRRRGC